MRDVCFVLAVAIMTLTGCAQSSADRASVAPTAVLRPSVSMWDVTMTRTGATSGDECFLQLLDAEGSSATSRVISVIRTDNHVAFVYDSADPPSEQLSEAGTVDGNEFTAISTSWPSNQLCRDGRVLTGTFETHLTGRFSEDGRHLAGKETWTYRLSSGESTVVFDWSGVER